MFNFEQCGMHVVTTVVGMTVYKVLKGCMHTRTWTLAFSILRVFPTNITKCCRGSFLYFSLHLAGVLMEWKWNYPMWQEIGNLSWNSSVCHHTGSRNKGTQKYGTEKSTSVHRSNLSPRDDYIRRIHIIPEPDGWFLSVASSLLIPAICITFIEHAYRTLIFYFIFSVSHLIRAFAFCCYYSKCASC